jgi:hypothetical protein
MEAVFENRFFVEIDFGGYKYFKSVTLNHYYQSMLK